MDEITLKVLLSDAFEAVHGEIDHLAVFEHPPEVCCADGEVGRRHFQHRPEMSDKRVQGMGSCRACLVESPKCRLVYELPDMRGEVGVVERPHPLVGLDARFENRRADTLVEAVLERLQISWHLCKRGSQGLDSLSPWRVVAQDVVAHVHVIERVHRQSAVGLKLGQAEFLFSERRHENAPVESAVLGQIAFIETVEKGEVGLGFSHAPRDGRRGDIRHPAVVLVKPLFRRAVGIKLPCGVEDSSRKVVEFTVG